MTDPTINVTITLHRAGGPGSEWWAQLETATGDTKVYEAAPTPGEALDELVGDLDAGEALAVDHAARGRLGVPVAPPAGGDQ
jgi:phage baseplate assembly protein gpV